MLKRLYIDNYKTFQNFSWEPGKVALLMGRNGTGKTALLDVLIGVRSLVCDEAALTDVFRSATRTRWDSRNDQTFELDIVSPYGLLSYHLVIQHNDGLGEERINFESLTAGNVPLFKFKDGEICLFTDSGQAGPVFTANWRKSGLATVYPGPANTKLTWFKQWLAGVVSVRPNPARIHGRAERESPFLEPDCSNFAAWYRSVWQERPEDIMEAFGTLKNVLDGFRGMSIRVDDERIGWLRATFEYPPGNDAPPLLFDELSDGQRTLIVLYTVLFTQLKPGRTVIFDEPDNYVALDEIQPFLMEALDRTERAGGPQLFVISHHPELINQLAADDGYTFSRENGGSTRILRFESAEPMAAAELIARGSLRVGTAG